MLRNFPTLLKRHPWAISFVNIGQRCTNKNHPKYKFYGEKGIAREISSAELRRMYIRDKAYLMKSPSIDRIDASQGYSFKNCRYLEMEENRREANDRRTALKQGLTIDELRDMVCKVNREAGVTALEVTHRFVSPPFRGEPRLKDETLKEYPKQLSGLHEDTTRQKIRISGSTRGGEGSFGGPSAVYGSPTGGSHLT